MTKKPDESELPNYYDELIHADNLDIDPECNHRNQKSQDTTLKSIRKTGLRDALIVREKPNESGKYLIGDGWNRYQCLVHELNWSHIPCEIKDNELEVFREMDRATEQNEFTKYQKVRQHGIWAEKYIERENLTKQEAVEEVYENSSVSRQIIRKRYKILQLPDEIHTMMKEPENRSNTWEIQSKYPFHESDGSLNIYAAKEIAKGYLENDFDDERAIKVAAESLKRNGKDVIKKAISECREKPDESVEDIFEDVKDRYKNPNRSQKSISAGTVHLGEDAETIHEYCRKERRNLNHVVKEALEEKAENLKDEYPYLDKVQI